LYPSVANISRKLTEECEIRGVTLPKGFNVSININATHHNPECWEDPDKFDPSRFLGENSVAERDPYAYIPFAAGPRNCIGQKFAMMEEKIILAKILRNFRIEVAEPFPVAQPALILRPKDGLWLKVYSRR